MTAAIPAEAFEHGDPRRYRRGCRCDACKAGANRRNIRNRYMRQTGRSTMRPTHHAADHLLRLRAAGLNDRIIREQTRICPDVMYRILRREGVIHARTEARITNTPVPANHGPTGGRAYIPAHGTVRRLRALVAAGWYPSEIARRLGKKKENLRQIIERGETGQVAQYIAEEIHALYLELHDQKPEQHGLSGYFVDRARKMAANRGWAPPAYWDDDEIDNPDFDPSAVLREPTFLERAALRREEIIHLAWCGHDADEIHARLNNGDDEISISTVRAIYREWHTGQKRDRKQVAA
ncbi:hypothetical protein [Streptomyces cadmiisoli]|uniref:hypothetical protein n=1 Tax=Streptomyces cadmiisoli TaxID=2184053 RepID=UPI0036516206